MAIPIEKIKKLREKTNISVAECKKALEEKEDDFDEALKILKKKGAEILEKKKSRQTKSGLVDAYLHQNGKVAAIVKVSCESDFASRNEEFRDFVHDLSMQIAAMAPLSIEELLKQPYIKDVKKNIKDLLEELVCKIGENVKIDDFKRLEL
ncbi:MAG: elongation factor Ts [Patescibacteria group bacterium]